jgi:hypothetical protein
VTSTGAGPADRGDAVDGVGSIEAAGGVEAAGGAAFCVGSRSGSGSDFGSTGETEGPGSAALGPADEAAGTGGHRPPLGAAEPDVSVTIGSTRVPHIPQAAAPDSKSAPQVLHASFDPTARSSKFEPPVMLDVWACGVSIDWWGSLGLARLARDPATAS